MTLNIIQDQRYPIYFLCVSTWVTPSPKSQSALGYVARHFQVPGHFETSALKGPKMTLNMLNTTRLKAPHICSTSTPATSLIHFNLWPAVFELQPIFRFWDNCTEQFKNSLNTTRSVVPYTLCSISTPESQISTCSIINHFQDLQFIFSLATM